MASPRFQAPPLEAKWQSSCPARQASWLLSPAGRDSRSAPKRKVKEKAEPWLILLQVDSHPRGLGAQVSVAMTKYLREVTSKEENFTMAPWLGPRSMGSLA